MSKGLRTFNQALELFRDLDPEMQAPAIATFVAIVNTGMDEDISLQDIQTATGLPSSSHTRNVQLFCKTQRVGKPGHNLVAAYEDINDRRRKFVKLTPKGRVFKERLLEVVAA